MSALVSTIEIGRSPDEVFAYVTDPARFVAWQHNVVNGRLVGDGPARVGTKCITSRRIGFATRDITSEITAISPPRTWTVQGLDGPIRAVVNVAVDPIDSGARSRVTIAIDFEGRGIGRILVPLFIRREARREMPSNLSRLKRQLEGLVHAAG
jgi:uncharacterized protein YndB with AHSA1/START domain